MFQQETKYTLLSMKTIMLKRSSRYPCVYILLKPSEAFYCLYVDNSIIVSDSSELIDRFLEDQETIQINQRSYMDKLLEQFRMTQCKSSEPASADSNRHDLVICILG